MPKNSLLDWSTTAASNTDVGGINIAEGCAAANINNAIRETMAQVKSGVDYKVVPVTKGTNYTALTTDNNAIIRFSAAATLSLTAAATLAANWHVTVVADGGDVVIDPNGAETINGSTTITIPNGYSTVVWCTGSAFLATKDYASDAAALALKANALQATVDVASATTTDIGAAASENIRITGTTTITGFGTVAAGTVRLVRMAGALTLTHNATSLILPGAANITTAADDSFVARSLGSGNWQVMIYQGANGQALSFTTPAFTLSYESAQQTITSGGSLTLAHGLGVIPKFVAVDVICTAAGGGYSIGDRIAVGLPGTSNSNNGTNITIDATNLNVRYGANANVFIVGNKGTGAAVALTNADWRAIFKAFA